MATNWATTLTNEDWNAVQQAPLAALYLVASASPSRGGSAQTEIEAAAAALEATIGKMQPTSLLGEVFTTGFDDEAYAAMVEADPSPDLNLRMLSTAMTVVQTHSPDEVAQFQTMLRAVARRSAEAAKEGAILGFGGVRVSEEEQAALEAIDAIVG